MERKGSGGRGRMKGDWGGEKMINWKGWEERRKGERRDFHCILFILILAVRLCNGGETFGLVN